MSDFDFNVSRLKSQLTYYTIKCMVLIWETSKYARIRWEDKMRQFLLINYCRSPSYHLKFNTDFGSLNDFYTVMRNDNGS